jgi:DNA-binding IclR family transcriptional regulator
LTTRALDIGYRYLQTSPILDRAAPYLAELSRRTEETVNLTILDGAEVVYLARHRGVHSIGVNVFIGARLPAFATGIGQVMLAFLPVLDATARLDALKRNQLTPHTITDLAALLKKLQRIRKAGYAVENQEMFLGGISIAAPILTRDNTALAALNVAVPTSRFTVADAERRFANVLLEIAREIRGPN